MGSGCYRHVVPAATQREEFCCSVRSLQWETVLHGLQQYESISQERALHKMLQCGSLFDGCLSETACSNMGSPQSRVLLGKLLHHGFLSSWVHGSQHGLPMGFSMDSRWTSASWWSSMGCRGTAPSPWSSPQGAGKSQLQGLEHLVAFLLHRPCCPLSCFSDIFSLLSFLVAITAVQ